MDNETNNESVIEIADSGLWKQLAKSMSQNASFTKSLSQECLSNSIYGNHDIKSLNHGEVMEFLNIMYDIKLYEPSNETIHLGVEGLVEWIWSNYVKSQIHSESILNHLAKLKDPFLLFKKSEFLLGLIGYYKKKLNVSHITDDMLCNQEILFQFIAEGGPFTRTEIKSLRQVYKVLMPNLECLERRFHDQKRKKHRHELNHPAVNEHMRRLIREGVKPSSVGKYRISYSNFLEWLHKNYFDFQTVSLDQIPFSLINETHLREYKSYLLRLAAKGTYSKHTVSDQFYDVRYLLTSLNSLGWVPKDITIEIQGIDFDSYHYRDLPTDADLNNFLRAIEICSDSPDEEKTAFGFMLWLGLRIHEVAALRHEDINLATRTLSVRGKNDKSVILPLPVYLQQCLGSFLRNKSPKGLIFDRSPSVYVRKLRELYHVYSKIAGWNFPGGPHLLRHTFVSRLSERKDCPPQLLMYLARHDRPENTARYIHRSDTQLRNAVDQLRFIKKEQ